jgi:two-component system chemotaxis response regulator CheY
MAGKKVLSVGQCNLDHGNISRALTTRFGAEVVRVDTADEALAKMKSEPFALVLVNRVFDSDGGSGLDLIRQAKAEAATARQTLMLVSNFPEAQAEAVSVGAVPGFGKASLDRPETAETLKRYL